MPVFTDPVAQAIIKNPKSQQEWKWTGSDNPDHPCYPYLTGLSMNYETRRLSAISMTIDVPYDAGISQILGKSSPFAVNNVIKARIGYAGGEFTDWGYGILNAGGDGLSIDANGVTGSVNFAMVAKKAFYTVAKSDLRKMTNYIKLFETVADNFSMPLWIGPDVETTLTAMSSKPVPVSALAGLDSLDIVKKVCEWAGLEWGIGRIPIPDSNEHAHLWLYKQTETVKMIVKESRNNYVMRGVIDVSKRQYPLLSWSPEGGAFVTWLADTIDPAASGVRVPYCDTATGVVDAVEMLPEYIPEVKLVGVLAEPTPETYDIPFPETGIASDKARSDEGEKDGVKAGEISGQPVAPGADGKKQAEIQAGKRVIDGNAAQTGVISTIGIPSERCERWCNVYGLGSVYDGAYDIRKITHTWGPGVYDMSLTVRRMGTGGQEKSTGAQSEFAGGQVT